MNDRSPEMLKPTLIAGVVFGVLGAVPFFNLLNCACCALIVGCGFFATYLYAGECRRQKAEFRAGTGAVVGLVSGAFYAMTDTLVGAVVHFLVGDKIAEMLLQWVQSLPNLPPEASEAIQKALEQSGTFSVIGLIMGFFLTLLLAAIFATVGGLIGGAVFKVPPSAPAPPPVLGGDLGPPPPSAPAV